jgi:hypothetical protein
MTIQAELPAAFEALEMTGIERRACDIFITLAHERTPDVQVISPRRTQSRDIKIMLGFPEGDTWEITKTLAGIANEVRKETGVYFILD